MIPHVYCSGLCDLVAFSFCGNKMAETTIEWSTVQGDVISVYMGNHMPLLSLILIIEKALVGPSSPENFFLQICHLYKFVQRRKIRKHN